MEVALVKVSSDPSHLYLKSRSMFLSWVWFKSLPCGSADQYVFVPGKGLFHFTQIKWFLKYIC